MQGGSRMSRAAVELLSSMRFSISLLTVICIASVIGTVLKQHEPYNNYVNQFGPFWADVFRAVSLYNVYSAWWFLLILAFLVISTSLCVARNTPKIWVDLQSYKENMRSQSLQAFGLKAQGQLQETAYDAAQRVSTLLVGGGWKVRIQERATPNGTGWMLAAKAGATNKIGYVAAHSAIVLVCIGGLLDGDLMVRAQMLFGGKTTFNGGGMMVDVAPQHRLPASNPTFRGNLLVTEGTQSATAVLNQSDGILLQDLPFSIELKKFIVEYYSTGMPKLFASDIIIHDNESGEKIPARVEVNHPARHRGIEIYQSSFDDGGSAVRFKALPIQSGGTAFDLEGTVGGSTKLEPAVSSETGPLTVEYTGLRVVNVENFGAESVSGADVRKVDLRAALDKSLGAANKVKTTKELRNVGPSVSYKLRDTAGQAKEFNNYMLPVDMGDGLPVFLWGMRESPSQPFRYLRVPMDSSGTSDDFFRLNGALRDIPTRELAIRRYVQNAVEANKPEIADQLRVSAARALALFAGDAGTAQAPVAGLQAVADFIEANVPQPERSRAGEVLVRILNGVLFEMAQITRERSKLPPLETGDQTQAFMTQAVLALSDLPLYPAPFVLQLADFTHIQASVFQVARAPGKLIVYLGCALLILGIFAMLYIRERRLWVWLEPSGAGAIATMALSANRKTMDGDREFQQIREHVLSPTVRL